MSYSKIETPRRVDWKRIRRRLRGMKQEPPTKYRRRWSSHPGPMAWSSEANRKTRRGFGLSHVAGYPSPMKRLKARVARKGQRAHRRRMAKR